MWPGIELCGRVLRRLEPRRSVRTTMRTFGKAGNGAQSAGLSLSRTPISAHGTIAQHLDEESADDRPRMHSAAAILSVTYDRRSDRERTSR